MGVGVVVATAAEAPEAEAAVAGVGGARVASKTRVGGPARLGGGGGGGSGTFGSGGCCTLSGDACGILTLVISTI